MTSPRRILVVTSGALFVRGGHMVIAEQTAAALRRAGYLSDVLVTPQNRFGRQMSAYLSTWLTDVGETADGQPVDQVISLRFPSYAVRHPRHVCWLNHRMREYYDLWERFTRGMGRRLLYKERVRRRIFHALDRRLLTRNVTRLVAQSRTIQERLRRFGGIGSELLYPPAPERPYRTDGYGDYVFAVSRLTAAAPFRTTLRIVSASAASRASCALAALPCRANVAAHELHVVEERRRLPDLPALLHGCERRRRRRPARNRAAPETWRWRFQLPRGRLLPA